jgi:hypothetical protein
MSSWDFKHEKNGPTSGTNPANSLKVGFQPFFEADNLASKRNVIATDKGWIRRTNGTGNRAGRQIDEVLVAAHPGGSTNGGYANSAFLAFPDVGQVYLGANTALSGNYKAGVDMEINVVFNEPIVLSPASSRIRLVDSNSDVYEANNTNTSTVINANNTLVFVGKPSGTGSRTVGFQTMTLTSGDVISLNADGESANLVISAAASNTLPAFTVVA